MTFLTSFCLTSVPNVSFFECLKWMTTPATPLNRWWWKIAKRFMLLSHGNRNEILFYDVLNVMGRGGDETGKVRIGKDGILKKYKKDLKVLNAVF